MSFHLKQERQFGKVDTEELLEYLTEERVLYRNGDKWYWMNDSFPAHNISLRSASQENIIIIDQTRYCQCKSDWGNGSFFSDDASP